MSPPPTRNLSQCINDSSVRVLRDRSYCKEQTSHRIGAAAIGSSAVTFFQVGTRNRVVVDSNAAPDAAGRLYFFGGGPLGLVFGLGHM